MILRRLLPLLALVLVILPRPSLAWWDEAWAFRKPLTLETTASGAGTTQPLADFPVLVRLHMGNFTYFTDTQADGSDLRFVAGDDQTPLSFQIESYDPATGMAFIWVKVPQLPANSSNTIYMYYGNPEAKSASDPGSAWDTDQALVYHFAGVPLQDSTRYANHPAEVTAAEKPGAWIGSGVQFAGTSVIKVGESASLRFDPAKGLTVSAWVNLADAQADTVIAEFGDGTNAVRLGLDGLSPFIRATVNGAPLESPRGGELAAGTWHWVAVVVDAARATLYVDGKQSGAVDVALPAFAGTLSLGAAAAGGGFLGAMVDEVQLAATARSPDWLQAQFANQGQNDALLRYGEDTQKDAGEEPSYFLITLRNVTVDGWVVIGILAVMGLVSWAVMIAKGLFIRRVRGDNESFIRDFRERTTANMAALDQDDDAQSREAAEHPFLAALSGDHQHYESSTLYRLYHVGIQEVKHRFAGATVGSARARTLSRESLDAIRASVDAASVRETQKLNSQMVLLTLSIAGGPFLGLLGTVVGVMITFAAIAASGDVNVNAIAPGIAAALAATVAGLGVAIPALFGYNWLASRIKEVIADNRVFIDEFLTKLAEQYS